MKEQLSNSIEAIDQEILDTVEKIEHCEEKRNQMHKQINDLID